MVSNKGKLIKPLTYSETLKILNELHKKTELSSVALRVMDYLRRLPICEDYEKALESLEPYELSDFTKVLIVNNCPRTLDELLQVLHAFESKTLSENKLKEILNTINSICNCKKLLMK